MLLQNNGSALPLDADTLPALAVIGMCAFQQVTADYTGGGGNLNNAQFVTLIQALYNQFGVDSSAFGAEGMVKGRSGPVIVPRWGSTPLHPTDIEPIHRTYLIPQEGSTQQGAVSLFIGSAVVLGFT